MVRCGAAVLRKYGSFIDDLRVYVRGGTGGMGYPRLGGEGGRGGDVWFVARERITLKGIKEKYPHKRFVAGTGANSSVQALKGEKGKDCEVHVPPGISLLLDDGKQIGELNAAGERFLAARGGLGGSLATDFLPCKGQKRIIHLDLKLIADVGLVGFPNAGKSSLLSKISHAKPEIASYAFTTIQPELGKIIYPDYKQVSVADLPGLIEGAHVNRGMGHKFLKHVERTKQLLLVVDISGFQLSIKTQFRTPFETILLLTKELELYKEELVTKPALLAINKMDLPCAKDNLNELMSQLQNPQDAVRPFFLLLKVAKVSLDLDTLLSSVLENALSAGHSYLKVLSRKQLLWANMGCRDVHAATVLAFLSGTASVAGLLAAVLLPNWRQMRLYTYNKNERNVTVYTGLWIKCARFDGSRDCVIYDPQWYTAVDQLDLRVLQFALPLSMFTAVSALFLCMIGMCNTAFVSTVPNVKLAKCLVNSAGCHLVAGLLFLLACAICLTPSIWVIFYNNYLNRKYEPVFSFDISVFIAIASAGGLFFTSILLFLWYCACKSLPSPFWQPLYSHAPSMHSYASQPYSTRSRLSTVELDIPVVTHSS
ncbi:GTP-binding protein 10 [Pitangus sulphuratus]|nr:GTP-binding protein 10 [Pitangus sulphuratus]